MKRNFSLSTIGGSALMMIFAVLCLTVFAVLSLSTAKAGERLSEGSRNAVVNYYEADAEAERILSALRKGDLPDGVETDGSVYAYCVPIDGRQSLFVEVMINGTDYTVLRWQAAVEDSMIEEEPQNLWDGTFDPME